MEKFQNLDWRAKALIIFIALIFIYGTIYYISLPKSPKAITPNNSTFPPPNQSQSIKPSPTTTQTNWQVYKTDQYKFTYPSDWKIEIFSHVAGGETTRIKPNYLSSDEYYPSIDVSVETASSASKLENFYSSMPAFRKIGNKYITTSMVKMIGGKEVKSPIQEVAVFINNGDSFYFFEYKYDGDKEDKKYEDIFNRIISSLESRPIQLP